MVLLISVSRAVASQRRVRSRSSAARRLAPPASWGSLGGALAEAQGAERSQADSLLVAWFKTQGVEAAAISLSELNKLYSGAISAIDDGTIK